jgi:hypothetical protein
VLKVFEVNGDDVIGKGGAIVAGGDTLPVFARVGGVEEEAAFSANPHVWTREKESAQIGLAFKSHVLPPVVGDVGTL